MTAFIATPIFIVAIPVFVHSLFSVPHARHKNVVLAGVSLVAYSVNHIFTFSAASEQLEHVGGYIVGAIFFTIILYSFLVGLYYFKKLQDNVRKNLGKQLLILTGIALPASMYDSFHYGAFKFFPLEYCGFSIVMIHYIFRHTLHHSQSPAHMASDASVMPSPVIETLNAYNISSREQDVVLLVLDGYNNTQIGEQLYISVNTVKTHLRNIYSKFDVKSRYELISLLNNGVHQKNPTDNPSATMFPEN
jgi:DNA-binding CsgD family transcriptional regulator